ncbi:MAG: nucleotidyltransferase family protein [Egibacteraceae bacterium]
MKTLADGRTDAAPPPPLEVLRQRRDEILALATQHGARHVRVFGSVARGEEDSDSDLDLLVDFDADVGLLRWAELIVALEGLLGCAVDVATVPSLKPRARKRALAEAVAL